MEAELKSEVDKLSKTCYAQQQVINNAINKGPANNTEACLQHEITRLTGENFDLREKIENLGDTIKRLKRQLKTYMKKLTEVGGEKGLVLKFRVARWKQIFKGINSYSTFS